MAVLESDPLTVAQLKAFLEGIPEADIVTIQWLEDSGAVYTPKYVTLMWAPEANLVTISERMKSVATSKKP